jgi:hypothetical protein
MQQRCPNCGAPIAPGQRFCGGCGAQLSTSCPYCRIGVSPGTRFCPNCGAPLGGGPPQQSGWGQQPGGMPQQPGWGQQPGGMPQQPGWGQQPGWAPPAPASQPSSSRRPLLVLLLFILLLGLGALAFLYTPLGDTIKGFISPGTGASATDTTPPTISNVNSTVSGTSVVITWETNKLASSQVVYGKTTAYESFSPVENDPTAGASAGVITHSATLTGLEPNTQYYYQVKSKDKAGNEAVSEGKDFTTTEASSEE